MDCKQKIVVVGAGPVGSLAALYAASRGDDVEIYELRSGQSSKRQVFLRFLTNLPRPSRPLHDAAQLHKVNQPGFVGTGRHCDARLRPARPPAECLEGHYPHAWSHDTRETPKRRLV